jgi:hypothetical protein
MRNDRNLSSQSTSDSSLLVLSSTLIWRTFDSLQSRMKKFSVYATKLLFASVVLAASHTHCAHAQWVDFDADRRSPDHSGAMDKVDEIQNSGPARLRAVNLARSYAVDMNGGLSMYRPSACMFSSSAAGCLISADSKGFLFRFNGGPPGWEQMGRKADIETEILIGPDGTNVARLIYNGRLR